MIDNSVFLGMNGAKHLMQGMQIVANNLANANTPGFRADLAAYKSTQVEGEGYQSRIYTQLEKTATDFTKGPMMSTGRNLDIAVQGDGWIAVQTKSGKEAYTRAGNLHLNEAGLLTTAKGDFVLGNQGIVAIPPSQNIRIGEDGTVSVQPLGQQTNTLTVVNRIKLVNPDAASLKKGEDGLFYASNGTAQVDGKIRINTGVIEGSNVSVVSELVNMIDLTRQFEMQVKMMQTADENAAAANELLNVNA